MYLHVTFFPHASMFGTPLLMNGKGELHVTETAVIAVEPRTAFDNALAHAARGKLYIYD